MLLKGILKKGLKVLYPSHCPICDEIKVFGEEATICDSCKEKTKKLEENLCMKCGKPLDYYRISTCHDCDKREFHYSEGRSLWIYEGDVKKSIHRYKYLDRKDHGFGYCSELVEFYKKNISWDIDMITSVPLHPKKHKQRSFNQAEILSNYLGDMLGILVDNHLLIRTKDTKPQKDLNDLERILNVKDAFSFSGKDIKGKNILIIDDIYTTGSTIDNCAKELKRNGAKEVFFLTLAIGKGH